MIVVISYTTMCVSKSRFFCNSLIYITITKHFKNVYLEYVYSQSEYTYPSIYVGLVLITMT